MFTKDSWLTEGPSYTWGLFYSKTGVKECQLVPSVRFVCNCLYVFRFHPWLLLLLMEGPPTVLFDEKSGRFIDWNPDYVRSIRKVYPFSYLQNYDRETSYTMSGSVPPLVKVVSLVVHVWRSTKPTQFFGTSTHTSLRPHPLSLVSFSPFSSGVTS